MLASTSRSCLLRSLVRAQYTANPSVALVPAALRSRAFRATAAESVSKTTPSRAVAMDAAEQHMSVQETEKSTAAPEATSRAAADVLARFTTTAEVTVSKIFPAGFGWQTASVVAGSAGAAPNSLPFFLMTGFGDLLGVLGGHVAYMALKKQAGYKVNLSKELDTGIWLGSAAFCSGFVWQPTLNACVDLGLSFNASASAVFGACTLAFYGGLRAFRVLYSPLTSVEPNNYKNLKADAGLAIAVGGATGCFVGTDVTFADNWLRPVVGFEDGTGDVTSAIIAGSSTAIGFLAVQSAQNAVLPQGKNWVDPA